MEGAFEKEVERRLGRNATAEQLFSILTDTEQKRIRDNNLVLVKSALFGWATTFKPSDPGDICVLGTGCTCTTEILRKE